MDDANVEGAWRLGGNRQKKVEMLRRHTKKGREAGLISRGGRIFCAAQNMKAC
jgi:hypothetical protein